MLSLNRSKKYFAKFKYIYCKILLKMEETIVHRDANVMGRKTEYL